ncbi:MAG: N-6 DNA methylase, partial [Burkholderiales bacterium]
AMDDCNTELEKENVKKSQIFGIEFEETAFGLATTNMLIHGDGNSNIIQGNCFQEIRNLTDSKINVVLMNPPYNAQRKHC